MSRKNRVTQGGRSVAGVNDPTSNRTSGGAINDIWFGAPAITQIVTPVLGTATATTGGFTFAITNYSALNTYVVSTTAGSASQTSGTVTQSGLGYSVSATVSVYATRSGFTNSATATRAGTSAACVPAGCTPPCGGWTYSYTTTCATGGGGSQVPGSCGSPGCNSGCRYYNLDHYFYSQQSCVDNCGITYYNTCADFTAESVNATCC
jgi:hypothetical protein